MGCNAGEEPGNGFFVSAGIKPADTQELRRICLQMSMMTKTGLDYLLEMPVLELLEIVKEMNNIGKEQKRIRNGNKNCR